MHQNASEDILSKTRTSYYSPPAYSEIDPFVAILCVLLLRLRYKQLERSKQPFGREMCRSLVGLIFNGAIAAPKREVADFQIHTLFERLLLYPSRGSIDIGRKRPVREKKIRKRGLVSLQKITFSAITHTPLKYYRYPYIDLKSSNVAVCTINNST